MQRWGVRPMLGFTGVCTVLAACGWIALAPARPAGAATLPPVAAHSAPADPTTDQPATGRAATVLLRGNRFAPEMLRVLPGTTVRWTNGDAGAHDVIATDFSFESSTTLPGHSFERSFDTPGAYVYVCDLHDFMVGALVVAVDFEPIDAAER